MLRCVALCRESHAGRAAFSDIVTIVTDLSIPRCSNDFRASPSDIVPIGTFPRTRAGVLIYRG